LLEAEIGPPTDAHRLGKTVHGRPGAASPPRCRKCGKRDEGFAVCRSCGYYAKLDKCVELDPEMEGFVDVSAKRKPFTLPTWAVAGIAIGFAMIAESVTVACMLSESTLERLCWSGLHMLCGTALVVGCHVRGMFMAMMDDPSYSVIDCLAWPPKIWNAVIDRLPKTGRMIAACSLGLLAMILSLAVLRSIPYGLVFKGSSDAPEYHSVIAEAVQQANDAKPKKPKANLEEAVEEFAGEAENAGANTGEANSETEPEAPVDTEPRQVDGARAIVIGFYMTQTEPYGVTSVVLAAANRNPLIDRKIEVLGVMPIEDPQLSRILLQRLWPTQQDKPVAESDLRALWVKPSVRCEVSYLEIGKDKEPTNLKLQRMY
jgi:hypothetical protein